MKASRLAARFLRKQATSPDLVLKQLGDNIAALVAYQDVLKNQMATIQALIAKGEARRLQRVEGMLVEDVRYDGRTINATVRGLTGNYSTRITLQPRGHHCTCADWEKNGRRVGPCKHVLALGYDWLNLRVLPQIQTVTDNLVDALEHTDL